MKRKDFKTSQYSCCSHGYTVKCISDIGLAIYGLYGQLIVDICVVMALGTLSPKVLQRVKVPSTCILRSFHNWAFASPTVYLWPRTSRLTKILQCISSCTYNNVRHFAHLSHLYDFFCKAIIFEQVGGMVSMGQMQSSCKLNGFLGSARNSGRQEDILTALSPSFYLFH